MKYKFIQKTKFGGYSDLPDSKVTHEVDTESLEDLLQHIEYFLRGCSFVPKGRLEFVEWEE